MQSSSRAVAALRRSARKNRGAWSSLQQQCIRALPTSSLVLPTSSTDVEGYSDSKPVVKDDKIKEASGRKTLAHRDIDKKGLIFAGTIVNAGKQYHLFSANMSKISQRHFASRSKRGNDDEDVLDDFESRLMGADYEGDDMYMSEPTYGMGAANEEIYKEWEKAEDDSETEEGDDGESEGTDEDGDEDAVGQGSDEDSDDFVNDASDEEFEHERTDEELDELLANTPLFDPPEPDFIPRGQPEPEFSFRPEGPVHYPGMQYDPEELDVTRPLPPRKRQPRPKEEISVQEVIDKADFRNVRFLTKFISETGTIIARKEFKMRTKSHNKVVKAIKTARFFGLMPYTNMGRPKFVFNQPFDEFAEFYEPDQDQKTEDAAAGRNNQGNFGNYGARGGNAFGQGRGGGIYRGSGNYFGQGRGVNNYVGQGRGVSSNFDGQNTGQKS